MDDEKLPVPQGLENELDNMVKLQMFADCQVDKILQFLNMRKCQLYWTGRQWLRPVVDINGQVTDYTELPMYGTQTGLQLSEPTLSRGKYDMVMNYVSGDGNKFCAVLGAKSPNPKCQALDSSSPEAEQRARLADRLLVALRLMWNVEEIHRILCLSAWKDGTFFLHTPWESDEEKYGIVTREVVEQVEQIKIIYACPVCGNQMSAGPGDPPPQCPCGNQQMMPVDQVQGAELLHREEKYPGAAPGCYPKSFYEVTMPFYVTTLEFYRTPWLIDEQDVPTGEVLERWPILWDKLGDAVDSSTLPTDTVSQQGYWARNLRANVNSDLRQTGRYRQTVGRIWLRPSQYNMFGNKTCQVQEGMVKIREWLKAKFPYGVKITRVGQWIVDMQAESAQDHWSVGTPMISNTVACDPIVYDFLGIQDAVNSADNLFLENMERNIPVTLVDGEKLNLDAMQKRQGVPGELIPVSIEGGDSLRDLAYNLPLPQVDGQQFGFRNQTLEAGREITGVQRSIFGAGNYSTAHEAELAKTQAMMQLSLAWKGLQACWQGAYTNGLKMLARYGADVLVKWGLSKNDVAMAGTLVDANGNLNGIQVRVDEGIPATWGQIHDTLTYLVQQGPPSWQITGLGHPSNSAKLQDGLGISDWVTPGSGAKDYILKLIRRLLAGRLQPQMNPDGSPIIGPDGQPVPPSPSEMIDPMVLPVGLGMPIFQEWFMSSDGMAAMDENPDGFANLHAAVIQWSTPPPMPNGPEGEDQNGNGPNDQSGPGPEPSQGHPSPPQGPPAPMPQMQNMGKGQ